MKVSDSLPESLIVIESHYHINDVLLRYSPAVFKEAVIKSIEDMTHGKHYKSDKLDIKVSKVRLSMDVSGQSKVDRLITMEINLKEKPGIKIKQQIHMYYTSQSVLVQGNRLLGGIKGFKILVEDFLQPLFNAAIEVQRIKINETKNIIDKVLEDTLKKAEKQDWFTCEKCGGKFRFDSDLKVHMKKHEEQGVINKRELSTSPVERTKKKMKENPISTSSPLKVVTQVAGPSTLLVSQVEGPSATVTVSQVAGPSILSEVVGASDLADSKSEEDMRMEIDEKNEEVNRLVKEMAQKEKSYKEKLNEVIRESIKMSDDLIAMQKERDLLNAKLDIYEKKDKQERYEKNLILFNHGGDLVLNMDVDENEDESSKEEVDECIMDIKCQGNCDPVVHQAQKLQSMKLQGGLEEAHLRKTQ